MNIRDIELCLNRKIESLTNQSFINDLTVFFNGKSLGRFSSIDDLYKNIDEHFILLGFGIKSSLPVIEEAERLISSEDYNCMIKTGDIFNDFILI